MTDKTETKMTLEEVFIADGKETAKVIAVAMLSEAMVQGGGMTMFDLVARLASAYSMGMETGAALAIANRELAIRYLAWIDKVIHDAAPGATDRSRDEAVAAFLAADWTEAPHVQ